MKSWSVWGVWSTSSPGGYQVDGLPPAWIFMNFQIFMNFHENEASSQNDTPQNTKNLRIECVWAHTSVSAQQNMVTHTKQCWLVPRKSLELFSFTQNLTFEPPQKWVTSECKWASFVKRRPFDETRAVWMWLVWWFQWVFKIFMNFQIFMISMTQI